MVSVLIGTQEYQLSFTDLQAISSEYQIPDVSSILPNRTGKGIKLQGLLDLFDIPASYEFITLKASADHFSASVPLKLVRESGILIYEKEHAPLSSVDGGPVRFQVPNAVACNTGEIDTCANVKFIDQIQFSERKRPDF